MLVKNFRCWPKWTLIIHLSNMSICDGTTCFSCVPAYPSLYAFAVDTLGNMSSVHHLTTEWHSIYLLYIFKYIVFIYASNPLAIFRPIFQRALRGGKYDFWIFFFIEASATKSFVMSRMLGMACLTIFWVYKTIHYVPKKVVIKITSDSFTYALLGRRYINI